MKVILLNLDKLNKRKEAQEYLAETFGFPDYYGKNLDALHDCLEEITEPVSIRFQLISEPNASDRPESGYASKILKVFRCLESEHPERFHIEIVSSGR